MSDKKTELITHEQQEIGPVDRHTHLIEMAISSGADIDKLEKLMDLQERYEANQARKAFNNAFANFQATLPQIEKTGRVGYENRDGSFTGFKHSTLADIGRVVAPRLAENGLSYRFEQVAKPDPKDASITLKCILSHKEGHSESTQMTGMPDTSGKKNAIQAIASTLTYMQRYTLTAILGLTFVTEDDDGKGGQETGQAKEDNIAICTDTAFQKNFPKWEKMIQDGATAEDILAKVQSHNSNLTEEQWNILKGVK